MYTVTELCYTVAQIWPKPFWFIEPYQHTKFDIVRTPLGAVTVDVVVKVHPYHGLNRYLINLLNILGLLVTFLL